MGPLRSGDPHASGLWLLHLGRHHPSFKH